MLAKAGSVVESRQLSAGVKWETQEREQVVYDTAETQGTKGDMSESGMSNLGGLELAGQPLRESRCLCSHRWSLHTDPRHSPLGLGAAFVPSAWPPWAIRVVEGGHSGSRHQHPRPDRPTPFNPTSSVHPRCPRNLLPHCPVLLQVATQSTGLLLGTPSNAPPRMAPESTARAC